MNIRENKKNQVRFKRGASITEVLVALTLFATFITGAAKVIMANVHVSDKARAHYTAVNIAKNRVESLRNMRRASYEQIGDMTETDFRVGEDGLFDAYGKFSRTTELRSTDVDELLEVRVTVKIQNRKTLEFGNEKEFIRSYMAKLLES